MNVHPAAQLFPTLPPEELQALAADIKEHGLKHPIVTFGGEVLDGRNRLKACELVGVTPQFEEFHQNGQCAEEFVVTQNITRRHLTVGQRAALAVIFKEQFADKLPQLKKPYRVGGRTTQKVADRFGLPISTFDRAATIKNRSEELFQKLRRGEVKLHDAYKHIRQRTTVDVNKPYTPPGVVHDTTEAHIIIRNMSLRGWWWECRYVPEMGFQSVFHKKDEKWDWALGYHPLFKDSVTYAANQVKP